MEIVVNRKHGNSKVTIGEMLVDGKFFGHTCEDTVRKGLTAETKVKGKTAIPAGRYEVACTFSNRFKKYLPLLLSVPLFEAIRIHGGNTEADSEGCILVGAETDGKTRIWNCAERILSLVTFIKNREKKEKIFITINDVPE